MSTDFWLNMNGGICVNLSRSIISVISHITGEKSGTEMQISGFGRNSSDGTPPINIRIFDLFGRGMSYFFDRSASWHGTENNEIENPEDDRIFKNVGH